MKNNSSFFDALDSIKAEDTAKRNGAIGFFDALDSINNEEKANKASQIKTNVFASTPIPPEKATQQYQMSRATGIPIETVRAKENEIKQMTELNSISYDDLVNNFPKTAAQLADSSKTAMLRDDVDNLTYFEKIVGNTKKEFQSNEIGRQTTDLRLKSMAFDVTGNENFKLSNKELNELYFAERDLQKLQNTDYKLGLFKNDATELAAQIPAYTLGQVPTLVQGFYGAVKGYGVTGLASGAIGAVAGAFAGPEAIIPGAKLGLKIGSKAFGRSGAGAGVFTESSKRMTADSYDEYKNFVDETGKPIEKSVAAGAAILTGGIGGSLELIPAKVATEPFKKLFTKESAEELLKTSIGREYLKNIASTMLAEGTTEAAQEYSNVILGEAAKYVSEGKFKSFGTEKDKVTPESILQYLGSKEVSNRVKQSFVAGSIGGAGFATVGGAANYAASIAEKRQQNAEDKKIIEDVIEKAKQSKILQRSPEAFKEATAETLGEQSVYLSADQVQTYFQSKTPQEIEVINAALPEIQTQIQEALDTGGNIVLKGNDMAVALATIPEAAGLQDFMKLSPESFSELEAQDAFLQNTVPSVYYEEQQRKSFTEQDAVKKNIEKQILNLGMPYRDAKDIITTTQSFYDTLSSRVGNKEAEKALNNYLGSLEAKNALYKEKPFKAVNKIEDLDLFLDKARKPIKTPKAGKPLIKMLKEKGGVQLGSNLAGELAALGINPKTMVGLFKKQGGLGDVDNFVASELQAKFPNATIKTEGEYVDRQNFLDLLAKEIGGEDISQAPNAEQEQVVSFLEELDRAGIDINASNEEIKKAIKEFEGRTFNQTQEIKLEQQGRYGSFYGEFNGANIRVSDHPAGKKAQTNVDGSYEGGSRSIGLEQYQELKEEGVKFYASDDFRDIVIPVKAKVDVDLENQVKIQERQIAEQKAFNSEEYQDLDKSELNNELIKLAEQRKKINKKLTYQLTEQDTQDLKQINKRENEIFESEEYKNQSEQKDKIFKDLVDKELEQLTEQEKEQAKTKAKEVAKDRKKDLTIKSRAKEKAVLDKFKKIEPFIKNKILELEGQAYYQTQPQTETPAFKKWFGDSKVVDKNGKPLVVYHGSNAKFDTFDIKKIGQTATAEGYGFYLTDNKDIAKGYQRDGGSLIEAYASMQKPLDSKQKSFNAKQISSVLSKMVDIEIERFSGEIADYKDSFLSNFVDTYSLSKAQAIKEVAQSIVDGNETAVDQISELSNVVGDKTTVPQAIRDTLGFDGIKVKDFQEGEGDVYIAWFPNQIKSVENKGTFDPNNPNIFYQSAFHGTPHKFDKFTLDNIGGGEGAQAYGWGLYFAGDKEIAEWYRKKLSVDLSKGIFLLTPEISLKYRTGKDLKDAAPEVIKILKKKLDEKTSEKSNIKNDLSKIGFFSKEKKELKADLEKLENEISNLNHDLGIVEIYQRAKEGQLYEVNIPEADTMLDWDNMLSKQPPNIQEAVKKAFDQIPQEDMIDYLGDWNADDIYELSGNELYQLLKKIAEDDGLPSSLKDYFRSDEGASKFLHANGINGIKYFDRNSRKKKEGQHNYVVFDDAAIDIVKTYYQTTPTFYSSLEKQITDLPQGKGSPEQWAGIIKNLTQKGVKQEELDWTGIEDWIKEQKGSVTKEQILDYLKANKIEVEEVVKGDYPKQLQDLYKQLEEKNNGKQFDDWRVEDQDEWMKKRGKPAETKFSKYTLAGGENYRELLLTLPEKSTTLPELFKDEESGEWVAKQDGKELGRNVNLRGLRNSLGLPPGAATDNRTNYRTTHFDEPNILAHIRFNERTDKDGARVMFVEELQSDWHQEGRKKGYKDAELLKKIEEEIKAIGIDKPFGQVSYVDLIEAKASEQLLERYKDGYDSYMRVPDAPFKTTWNELAFKRALLWAVENNFDKVAWTTGEQQAERYDLSKQLDKLDFKKNEDGTISLIGYKNDEAIVDQLRNKPEDLEGIVGKDIAKKVIESKETRIELSGVDLKVGGEGMKAFYDKIVPTMVNKLAKKFGGKVETSNIKKVGNVWSLEITPAMRESIQKQGLPLFQNESNPRGQTQFIGQKPIITLFEGKNKSTVLHELGHVFLQINRDIAAVPNVSEQIKNDWKILENWLGIKDGNITTEAHEKFARGFEAYLREGKAPSIALRDAFRRFKAWLIRIYKDVSELNVKLTNEVRDVFDRMFATDEAIESLKNNPIFRSDDQILELLTAAEKKDYQKLNDTANEKAKEKLLTKALKQKEIENKKFYKEERAAVKKEVESEMNQDKTFRLVHFLKTGQLLGEEPVEGTTGYKLSREDIKNNYDTEFLKYLPADILAKDGVPVDMVAEEFGFNDAGQMLYAIANVSNFKEELKKATDAEMVRRYGDMLYDGTIENEALDASENEARANKILYELNAANRKVKTFVETKEAYKQKAKEIIATKQIKDATDTNTFYLNEVKAAREAGKALGQKDYAKAVEWKKKQLLNHYLFRESLAIKNEVQKALKSYTRIKKKPKAGKVTIDEDFRLKAVNLLQDFNLAPKGNDYQKTNVADLETWKQEQTDSGVLGLVEFPELAEFQDKDNIRSLTTDQFRTFDDAIQNLVTVGRNINILEVNGKKQELNSIVDRIIEQANTNIKKDKPEIEDPTEKEKLVKAFNSYASSLIKTSQTTLKIDGEKNLGEFYQLFEKDLNDAELNKNKMADESYKKLDAIFNKHFGGYKISDKRTYFDSVGKSYSKKAVLAFALNWGNEINRTRVRDGFNYSDAQVIDIISSLNKNELEFVQDIWDLINSYWSAIEATEKKLFGIAPKKQSSIPLKVVSKDGYEVSLKGGYYPLAYTAEANFKSDTAEDLKQTLFGTGFDKVNFHKSFTKERAEQKVNKKIVLDLNPLSKHLTQIINDIAMKPAAWNAYRIINNRRLKTNLVKKIGIAEYKQLQSWVYDMYGRTITQEGFIAKAANLSRDITVTWTMGFKLATAIIQPTGLLQSIVKIGYKNMGLGVWKALGNGNPVSINKAAKLAFAKSKILEDRSKTMTRDIYEVIDRLQKSGKLRKEITKFAFLATTKMQMLADLPTWYGAYYKGLKDFKGDDAKAVELADRLVIETQGSSYKQSLSAIQRDDSALVKAFTIFGNYANVKLNLLTGSYRQTNFKKPKDTAKFISDFALLFAVDAILTEFLREGISNLLSGRGEDDEEDKTLHYANLVAGSLLSPIPVASQIYSGLNYGRESYYPSGFKGISIVGGGVSKLGVQAVNAVSEDEEVDLIKVMQGINETSAIFTMGGGAQIDIFLKALKEEREGNEPAPVDFILKPAKK